jgi:hypothetical protein
MTNIRQDSLLFLLIRTRRNMRIIQGARQALEGAGRIASYVNVDRYAKTRRRATIPVAIDEAAALRPIGHRFRGRDGGVRQRPTWGAAV